MVKGKSLLKKLLFLGLMSLFGLLGPIVRAIGLPSVATACFRAWIAAIGLGIFSLVTGHIPPKEKNNGWFLPMAISGVLLAGDWIGLFQSYRYTTVATATVCYYIVPVLVFLAAPVVLKERFSLRHAVCAAVAFAGMVLVSGVADGNGSLSDLRGPVWALVGAVCYAAIILINKRFPGGDIFLRTLTQLGVAALVTTPYMLGTHALDGAQVSVKSLLLLLILGLGLTAATYVCYFKLVIDIPARTVAIFSYADPVVSVILSVTVLGEALSFNGFIGALLVIGAAAVSEFI